MEMQKHMYKEFEMITLATREDVEKLKITVPYYQKNLNSKVIYVISPQNIKYDIEQIKGVVFVDESEVYPGLDIRTVEDIIYGICGERKRAGWYLQQFLKMAWALRTKEAHYIEMDSDTFPLHEIHFMDENDRYLLTRKIEYNPWYFDTLDKLFNGEVKREDEDVSYVAEHMIFDTEIMREMIQRIEDNDNLEGTLFFEKILNAIDPEHILRSGFSEFETYGNYVCKYHKNRIRVVNLETLREAVCILGSNPTSEQLVWARADYDIISIEDSHYPNRLIPALAKSSLFRKFFRMKTVANIRQTIRSIYRKLLNKEDFRFE